MTDTQQAAAFDSRRFRAVLGHFPTGVAAVTAVDDDGEPIGMAVGSFTSVSLDPPMVAFLPDKGSSTFPRIREAGSFCVNVLSADQEHICRQFATRGGDKFAGLRWTPSRSGAPILDGIVAWIDCELTDVVEAGDHYIALGSVRELSVASPRLPLLFFQGGYGKFSPASLVAPEEAYEPGPVAWAHRARVELERLSATYDVESLAASLIERDVVVLATTSRPGSGLSPTAVGQRIPFVAPFGALWLAWDERPDIQGWVDGLGGAATEPALESYRRTVSRVRDRGWSIGLGDPAHSELEDLLVRSSDPAQRESLEPRVRELSAQIGSQYEPEDLAAGVTYDVRNISAPVFDSDGDVVLTLTLYSFARRLTRNEIETYALALREACTRIGEGGR